MPRRDAPNLQPTLSARDRIKVAYAMHVMGQSAQEIAHFFPGVNPGRISEAGTALLFAASHPDRVNDLRVASAQEENAP